MAFKVWLSYTNLKIKKMEKQFELIEKRKKHKDEESEFKMDKELSMLTVSESHSDDNEEESEDDYEDNEDS